MRRRWLLGLSVTLFIAWWLWLPSRLFPDPLSTVLVDGKGGLLCARIAADGQWRFPEPDSIPVKFKQCILAFEDEYFNYHPGFNPVSLARALAANIRVGRVKNGGSTITMQTVRMMRRNRPRSYYQKFAELLLALRVECSYSKSSILKLYCANAPFGGNVVGLTAASWRHFGRPPHELSWAESAALAVLPNAPGLIYPGRNHDRLLAKRNFLLRKLLTGKVIDEATYKLALLEPLPAAPFPLPQLAPHLADRCILESGEGRIYNSTLDRSIQHRTGQLLDEHVKRLSENQIHNACAIVAETVSGEVLAYVGNSAASGQGHDPCVDIARSPRSTGSILKPFLYACMLSESRLLPHALVEDVPVHISGYGPQNFSRTYDGLVPASQALARSLNVPAVKMLQEYGVSRFRDRLKQFGFTTFRQPSSHYGLSLILGGGEASLFELASAYAAMGRALEGYNGRYSPGSYRPLVYLRERQTRNGPRVATDLVNASSLYFTLSAMTELVRPEDYVGWSQFMSKHRIAWKTGTSYGFRDGWAIGLNAKYTVAVWVGNARGEGRPELTGVSAAAPLMFAIFNALPRGKWFRKPSGDLTQVRVCSESGYRASDICPSAVVQEVPQGAAKSPVCSFHKLLHLDESGSFRVNSDCYPVSEMKTVPWFVATPLQESFYRQRSASCKPLPPFLNGCRSESLQQMEIVYPRNGYSIFIPTLVTERQSACVMKATHKNDRAVLFWHLDGEYIGNTTHYHQMALVPGEGEHVLDITDESGESASCRFTVLAKRKG